MMLKILAQELSGPKYTNARLLDARRLTGIQLVFGGPLSGRFPAEVRIQIETKAAPADYFLAGPMPIVSDRIRRIWDSFGANVEYHKVAITLKGGGRDKRSFFFSNILDVVDCLDRQASVYTPDEDYATELRKIVLKESVTESPVFLVGHTTSLLICLQPAVCAAMQGKCTGFSLQTAAEWKNAAYPTIESDSDEDMHNIKHLVDRLGPEQVKALVDMTDRKPTRRKSKSKRQ